MIFRGNSVSVRETLRGFSVRSHDDPFKEVTISVEDTPKGGALKVEWGTKSASIPFTVG